MIKQQAGWIAAREEMEWDSRKRTAAAILAHLSPGWDVVQDARLNTFRPLSVARDKHLFILEEINLATHGLVPVVDPAMHPRQLLAGFYRQLNLLPDSAQWRWDTSKRQIESDRFLPASSLSRSARRRAGYVYTIAGVDLETAVDWLVWLRAHDLTKFTLLLGKDLEQALGAYPELEGEDWPAEVSQAAERAGRPPRVKPFAALALVYEMMWWAQGNRALLGLSFHGPVGALERLAPAYFLLQIPNGRAHVTSACNTLASNFPIQAVALVDPAPAAARRERYRRIANSAALIGRALVLNPVAFDTDCASATSGVWRECAGELRSKGWFKPAPGQTRYAAHYHGLDWRDHASVGLLRLHELSFELYGRVGRSTGSLSKAVAAIKLIWLETTCPEARAAESRLLIRDASRNDAGLCPSTSSIEDYEQGLASFGRQALEDARMLANKLPKAGKPGYSAMPNPHLWYSCKGDDLPFYEKCQRRAVRADTLYRQQSRAGRRNHATSKMVQCAYHHTSGLIVTGKRVRMRASALAARSARSFAMRVGAPSLDGVWKRLFIQ